MKNETSKIDVITILQTAFLAVDCIKDKDLDKFLEASSRITTRELIALLLKVQPFINDNGMKRILSFIPSEHQELFEFLLSRISDNKNAQKLYELYNEAKSYLATELKSNYILDQTKDKILTKKYLNSLSHAKLSNIISALKSGEQTLIDLECIALIENIENKKK